MLRAPLAAFGIPASPLRSISVHRLGSSQLLRGYMRLESELLCSILIGGIAAFMLMS